MALPIREQLESQGNWIFKHRSFLPLFICPLFLVALWRERETGAPSTLWQVISLCISFVGLGIRALTVAFVPAGTSGRNTDAQRADSLNTKGFYSIVRHPIYLGNFLIFFGIVLFSKIWWFILISVLLFWLYYERIIFAEEEFLRNKFGELFLNWAKRTPTIIPNIRKWTPPELGFSVKSILKREYSGFFTIVVSFTLMRLATNIILNKKIALESIWIYFFVFGAIIYFVCRTLKKKTKLLDVAGR